MYRPELLNSLRQYSARTFTSDLIAGFIVGIVALPLAIAFAIASGVGPEAGLFTAIIAGFCISAFGGSSVQIGGPTGAFAVIVYGVVAQFGVAGLATATVMAGILLILLGAFKMGGLVKFIPYTIVTGFTAGIAVTIAAGQIGDFLGMTITRFPEGFTKMPGDFVGKLQTYALNIGQVNLYSFAMAAVSLLVLFMWPRFNKRIPGSLVVILAATAVSVILSRCAGLETDTIGSRYGSVPSALPVPKLPDLRFSTIRTLFPTAVSIAVLAAIESLLSAVVADSMTGAKHNSDTELIGQGIANIASPLFGGIPATGAIARTATNIKNGGRTPVAGIVHAVTLLLILLFLGRFVVYIPMAALAAVLINVAWNMAGFKAIGALVRGQKSDICVLTVTFLITVFIDLTVAIEVGLGFAVFFFIKKMCDLSEVQAKRENLTGGIGVGAAVAGDNEHDEKLALPAGAVVYEIDGPLFFGTVRKFEVAVTQAQLAYKVLILRMRNTIYLDAGGVRALEQAMASCAEKGVTIVLSGIHTQPYLLCKKTGILNKLGEQNVCAHIDQALARAKEIINGSC